METRVKYESHRASVLLCREVYDTEAILAASYLLTEHYCIEINDTESDHQVAISSKDDKPVDSSLIESFLNNCLDEQLRIALEKRSGKIRELIVKHAFKPLDILKELEQANAQ